MALKYRDYIISIGLNVGDSEPARQMGRTLDAIEELQGAGCGAPEIKVIEGEWEGVPERTVQACVTTYRSMSLMLTWGRIMCSALNQQAIAILPPGENTWMLATPAGAERGGSVEEYPVQVGGDE